jgi:hypothetical protein
MKIKISTPLIALLIFVSSCLNESKKMTLQASNNMYVVLDKDSALVANEPNASKAEIFERVRLGNGKCALKTSKGKFVSHDRVKENRLFGNRNNAYEWETFEIIRVDPTKINLKSSTGKMVCTDQAKGNVLIADRDYAGDWETFTVEKKK